MQNICIKTLFSRTDSGVTDVKLCIIIIIFSYAVTQIIIPGIQGFHLFMQFYNQLHFQLLQDISNKYPKIMLNNL